MDTMKGIMSSLRAEAPADIAGHPVVRAADYLSHEMKDTATGAVTPIDLPAADVLIYWLANGASVIVRPSGTEPKLKAYLSASGKTQAEADEKFDKLVTAVSALMDELTK